MIVAVYEAQLTGEENITVTAGEVALQMSFKWNDMIQEQWDMLVAKIEEIRDGDPLSTPNSIDRTYDLLDYYVNTVPPTVAKIHTWLATSPALPVTIKDLDTDLLADTLLERRETYVALNEWKKSLEESLVWQVRISDANGGVTVADVRNGGIIRGDGLGYFVTFVSDDKEITRDRLGYVTCVVEVVQE